MLQAMKLYMPTQRHQSGSSNGNEVPFSLSHDAERSFATQRGLILTCITKGSRVRSTERVLISKFLGSHLSVMGAKSWLFVELLVCMMESGYCN